VPQQQGYAPQPEPYKPHAAGHVHEGAAKLPPGGATAVGAAMPPPGAAPPPSAYQEQMEQAVRMGFIRKVYSVLAIQLLVTFGIVGVFTLSERVREYVQTNPALLWAAIGVQFVTLIALVCCSSVTRTHPWNYIALGVFTLAESYLVGTIASFYKTDAVMIAVGGTVLLCAGLTLFAWQTRIDFTAMSSSIFVIALSFMFFGLLCAIFRSNVLRLVYACVGVIVFGLFLVYDTQLILGGKHREYAYGPDDWVLAALNVYLDIVQLFLFLLQLFGSRRD
jgi:FtsH-binding integral membrane protein